MKPNSRPLLGAACVALVLAAVVPVLSFSGCSSSPTSKSTGQFVDDTVITTKVKTALAKDPVVSVFAVGVDTYKGVVQLNGFVSTQAEKDRAETVASRVNGVTSVTNNLSLKPGSADSRQSQS